MKFVGYILRKVLPFFLVSLFFISLILNLVDLFMHISTYLERQIPAQDILAIMLYYTPKTIWYAGPMAFLFSVTYVLSDLYSHNEMQAIFASGISLFRFVFPILLISLFLSIGMLYFEDRCVVSALEKKNELQAIALGENKSANNEDIVVLSNNGNIIYKAYRYRDKNKKLERLILVFRTEEKLLQSVIYAPSALWNQSLNKWDLINPSQYDYLQGELKKVPISQEKLALLTENYDIFQKKEVNVETVDIKSAKIYIEHLKKAGLPYNEELSVYYKKFAFSLIFFIAAFLAIGLTGRTRKNVLLISLSFSLASVVLYYVFQMMTMVLAKTQFISPFMGAWFPNFVFLITAIILLKYSKT